ncbi:MAG: RidA family protein [Alphaproteobacteria bacterium]|nr:RidA family protein [Alphaproteobacteria bacterium]
MLTRRNPDSVHAPRGYSHSVEAPAGAAWVYISGQVGIRPDGSLVEDARGQIDQVWVNLGAQLEAAGLSRENIVKVNVFLTRREDIGYYRESRGTFLGDNPPASTLLFVSGLADPAMVVEIEAMCVK